jgi:hypothetical protein
VKTNNGFHRPIHIKNRPRGRKPLFLTMTLLRIWLIVGILFTLALQAGAQSAADNPKIRSVKLFRAGDQTSFPVIQLNSSDQLQLEFDELGTAVVTFIIPFSYVMPIGQEVSLLLSIM